MKKMFRNLCVITAVLFVFMTLGCASNKGEKQEIDDESFTSRIVLIASGSERLVKFEIVNDELVPGIDKKNIKSASLEVSIYSGRRPAKGAKEGTPVVTMKFDLLKDADKLLKGYDLMANAKTLKTTAKDLNSKLSADQYYYAKGNFEASVKEGKTVTKAKTLFSNDTIYTPLQDVQEDSSNSVDAK